MTILRPGDGFAGLALSADTLSGHLTDDGASWIASAVAKVQQSSSAVASLFPAVSRRCGRAPLVEGDERGLHHGCVDDAVRALLLQAIGARGQELIALIGDLYRYGDAGEKRGVLRALHVLDKPLGQAGLGAALLPAVEDGLRTNDVRLVAAALTEYGANHLTQPAFRQAIVKCVFVGVPLSAVHGLSKRQDADLARMLVDLANERIAAGRAVPTDIPRVVSAFPDALCRPDLSADIILSLTPINKE